MPKYDYRCTACKKEYEVEQRMSDPPLSMCKLCKSKGRVKRLVSKNTLGIVFKGPGFYITDSRKKTKAKPKKKTTSKKTDKKKKKAVV
ncbi:FmdB family zinc ribbon protein [Candidatus Margulisiibacteriota bacterium]